MLTAVGRCTTRLISVFVFFFSFRPLPENNEESLSKCAAIDPFLCIQKNSAYEESYCMF